GFSLVPRRSFVIVCSDLVGGADIDHYRGLTLRPQPPTVGRVSTPRERLDHTMTDHTATAAPTARERMRGQWERRRAETDHVTIARECPMVRVYAYWQVLAVACSRNSDARWAAALRNGAPRHAGSRARWEVLVIA